MSTPLTQKTLIVVGGPTASGKTSLGIALAKYFKTEILSADSRQFYKELNIGVARPAPDELQAVKHHFIGHKSIEEYYSAGDYERDALSLLHSLFEKHDFVVMVGGSGLFINAVLHGFHPAPKDDGTVRKAIDDLFTSKGITGLVERLKELDPVYAQQIDVQNPQRLMRALERVMISGNTHKELTEPQRTQRFFNAIEIAIDYNREVLYDRINKRVDLMMKAGLLEEVKGLVDYHGLNALKTVGYSEMYEHLDGSLSLEEAVEKVKQNTRRYAKRQITWFKNKSGSTWFKSDAFDEVVEVVKGKFIY